MLEARRMESEIGSLTVQRVDDDVAVLSLKGEHDVATADVLWSALSSLISPGTGLVVDLTRTRFVACATMHILEDAQQLAARRGAKVTFHLETAPIVQRMFELLGASGRWPMHRSREDAIAAVRPGSEIGRRGGAQKTYT
jgi:anti-anti-sigma factor